MPTPGQVARTLDALVAEIRACRKCRDDPERAPPLPHEPHPVVRLDTRAPILIVGQAPGTRVHRSGLPFDDASGDRLRRWLGVDRATFYDVSKFAFAPMGFCFPGIDDKGADRPPRPECAPIWQDRVMAALPAVELILLIGAHAQKWHLDQGNRGPVSKVVAEFRSHFDRNTRPRRVPLPHPSWRNTAWIRNNPWFERDLVPALQAAIAEILRVK